MKPRHILHFEKHHHPVAPRAKFALRLLAFIAIGLVLIGASLALGMWGYMHYEGLEWRDAFLNSAMLLGGMGPVEVPLTPEGKLFAGAYALYAGLVFLIVAGVVLAPVVHRALHVFHGRHDEKSST